MDTKEFIIKLVMLFLGAALLFMVYMFPGFQNDRHETLPTVVERTVIVTATFEPPTVTPTPTYTPIPTATGTRVPTIEPTVIPTMLPEEEDIYIYWYVGAHQEVSNALADYKFHLGRSNITDTVKSLQTVFSAADRIEHYRVDDVPQKYIVAHNTLWEASLQLQLFATIEAERLLNNDTSYKNPQKVLDKATKLLNSSWDEFNARAPNDLYGG